MADSDGFNHPANRPNLAATGLAIVRLGLGAMFVWVFFENLGKGLYGASSYSNLINYYIEKGHAPQVLKSMMEVMASHANVAGPIQGTAEISLGVLLIVGLLTRPVALAAFLFLTMLWVAEWGTAWIWELLIPMIVALSVMIGAAGRKWGLDAVLARKYPRLPLW